MPAASARARVGGSLSPGPRRPSSMAAAKAATSWPVTEASASRSIVPTRSDKANLFDIDRYNNSATVGIVPMTQSLTIRMAYPDDRAALERLATLDARPLPSEPLLVAEV